MPGPHQNHPSSLRQLMTAAPELFSDIGCCLQPKKESDTYSFGILAYEVVFQTTTNLCRSIMLVSQ